FIRIKIKTTQYKNMQQINSLSSRSMQLQKNSSQDRIQTDFIYNSNKEQLKTPNIKSANMQQQQLQQILQKNQHQYSQQHQAYFKPAQPSSFKYSINESKRKQMVFKISLPQKIDKSQQESDIQNLQKNGITSPTKITKNNEIISQEIQKYKQYNKQFNMISDIFQEKPQFQQEKQSLIEQDSIHNQLKIKLMQKNTQKKNLTQEIFINNSPETKKSQTFQQNLKKTIQKIPQSIVLADKKIDENFQIKAENEEDYNLRQKNLQKIQNEGILQYIKGINIDCEYIFKEDIEKYIFQFMDNIYFDKFEDFQGNYQEMKKDLEKEMCKILIKKKKKRQRNYIYP
ncbi:hypothetical protein IMG5_163590, partial [Ichthyophthirius multifiliis]